MITSCTCSYTVYVIVRYIYMWVFMCFNPAEILCKHKLHMFCIYIYSNYCHCKEGRLGSTHCCMMSVRFTSCNLSRASFKLSPHIFFPPTSRCSRQWAKVSDLPLGTSLDSGKNTSHSETKHACGYVFHKVWRWGDYIVFSASNKTT